MADFSSAYKIVRKNEGGYVNNPDDPGKETYKGVSRVFNPDWAGWPIIDLQKQGNQRIGGDRLDFLVRELFKKKYWDVFGLDSCSNQMIAYELFDSAINLGVPRAGRWLQYSLNCYRDRGTGFPALKVDGWAGPTTQEILALVLLKGLAPTLWKMLNALQGARYIMNSNRPGERGRKARVFVHGLFRRVFEDA